MRTWGNRVIAVAVGFGVAACGGGGHHPSSASPDKCAAAQQAPANLAAVDPAAAGYFPRIASACIVVDGKRLSNANVAISIADMYGTEVRTAASMPGAVSPAPISSPAWLHWGAAHAVLAQLVDEATEADHPQVSDEQVKAAVANCQRTSKQTHITSSCSASDFRHDFAIKAEQQRIEASGQSIQQWFAAQLPKHTVVVRGYDVTVSQLVTFSERPPGCNELMGCQAAH